ncbi:MAG: hypothetical protein Q7U16_01885 [Agitococcus sp.]|nr:hypothetical protein [Agitococcus sp.]
MYSDYAAHCTKTIEKGTATSRSTLGTVTTGVRADLSAIDTATEVTVNITFSNTALVSLRDLSASEDCPIQLPTTTQQSGVRLVALEPSQKKILNETPDLRVSLTRKS